MTERLLKLREVCELRGRSVSSLYRDIEAGLFLRSIKICGSARWPESDVIAERERLIAERNATADPAEPADDAATPAPRRRQRGRAA